MTLIVHEAPKESTYILPSPGLHQAVCFKVEDLGNVETPWGEKHKCRLHFQVEETDSEGRRLYLAKTYTVSLNEKSNLRKDLERWRGRAFRNEELQAGFDIGQLRGLNATIFVGHTIRGGNNYCNVDTIMPPQQGKDGRPQWHRLEPD